MKKGFTLIELLVVIAIIGILAAIIIANLGDARNLAKDSSGSATLSSARGQAELFYVADGGNSYSGMCDTGEAVLALVTKAQAAIGTSSTAKCYASPETYAAQITLSDESFYCIDSTGFAGETVLPLAGATVCP